MSKRSFSSDGGAGSGSGVKANSKSTDSTKASSSSSSSSSPEAPATGEGETLTLSLLWKRYGTVAIATHFGVYFVTLAGLYGGVSAGLLGQGEEKKEAVDKVKFSIRHA